MPSSAAQPRSLAAALALRVRGPAPTGPDAAGRRTAGEPASENAEDRPSGAPGTGAGTRRGTRPGARPGTGNSSTGAGGDLRYWLWLLPALTLLAALTRLPSFAQTLWNPDEGFVATQARQLADGGVLYDTVVDRKPPLLPWLYRGAFAVFGDESLWPLKVAAILAIAATAGLVAAMARRRWGDRAGWTAGVLAVLIAIGLNPEDTQAASFEVFMLPWTAAAMWCADRRRWVWAGVAVALATLTKQTGGAVLLPVLFVLARAHPGWSRERLMPVARLLAAYLLPIAVVAFAFGAGRFSYWTATGSGSYASVDGAVMLAAGRAAGSTAILTVACLPLLIALVYVTRVRRRPLDAADLWVWLAASGVAVAFGFQFYGHYFLQLTPALALLATAALGELSPRAATAAVAATAVLAAAFVGWGLVMERPELEHAKRVSAAVKRHTEPADRVLVWGMHPEDYWLSDRTPATRFLTAGFLTNYSGGRGGVRVAERYGMPGTWDSFRRDLREQPPRLIVDDSRGKPYRPARIPTLRRYLDAHYEKVDTVGGAVFYLRSRP
ncbi:glycosyltransferase family 39 protein [Streptomyces sp. N2-109]|uniref:Glycosyltransferase family 39 protein n=1 Tax=Streptomyces gossypii TaxID=2883101 RepID=A0ABT2JTN1_9ACTN|nr:glycosyltransferase family 39 protein [Streptomyces gossypii]MCT2590839.1 glycosyltransferase family 39 protein [Streptomyces gossypii]